MGARILALFLCLSTLLGGQNPAGLGKYRIYVDGIRAADRGLTRVEDGEMWVPVRELSILLGATTIAWEEDEGMLTVLAPGMTLTAKAEEPWLEVNGVCLLVEGGLRPVRGGVLAPLDTLCRAYGASWQEGEQGVEITSGAVPVPQWQDCYYYTDLYWLSRLVHAESQSESFECKVAVAEVVVNRLASDWFPDTVREVIFDQENGVQFSPTLDGNIYNSPSGESIAAAKAALCGSNTMDDDVLFFVLAGLEDDWVSQNRPFVTQIGVTAFYA